MVGPLQSIHLPMRRFRDDEEVDYAVVGVGSAGGVLVQRLTRAGFNVVGLEAGPFWDTQRDWVSDEAGAQELYWREPRVTGGKDPLALGANNCGQGVGGGSVHWAAFPPGCTPPISRSTRATAWALTGPSAMQTSSPITSSLN